VAVRFRFGPRSFGELCDVDVDRGKRGGCVYVLGILIC